MNLTGKEFKISYKNQQCLISQIGASLKSYTVDKLNVIVPFENELPHASKGAVLFPYPNRLQDGKYKFENNEYQLPINEVKNNNQIHGLVSLYKFDVVKKSVSSITLMLELPPSAGYPFLVKLTLTYSLSNKGLTVKSIIENYTNKKAPVGIGFHPWLDPRGNLSDSKLEFKAKKWISTNKRLLPTGKKDVPNKFDFSTEKAIKNVKFDDAFIGLKDNQVKFTAVDGHITTVWASSDFNIFQICNSVDGLNGIAVEPMTCAANAFNTKDFLIVLKQKEKINNEWGIIFK
jgi:aldose 1-epimerase